MTSAREPDRFAIVPLPSDSTGAEVKYPNAIMTGDMTAVMARIKDSKQMREDLRISNEADKVRRAKAALKVDQEAFATEQAAFATEVEAVKEVLLNEFVGKLDALIARMDEYEAKLNHDPDDDKLPLPPGTVIAATELALGGGPSSGGSDDGELEASHPPSRDKHREQLEAGEDDDEGGVPLSYGNVPTTYVHGEDQSNELPGGIGVAASDPHPNPRDLAHPQRAQQQLGDEEDLPAPPPLPVA
jgi:hypothetical protein